MKNEFSEFKCHFSKWIHNMACSFPALFGRRKMKIEHAIFIFIYQLSEKMNNPNINALSTLKRPKTRMKMKTFENGFKSRVFWKRIVLKMPRFWSGQVKTWAFKKRWRKKYHIPWILSKTEHLSKMADYLVMWLYLLFARFVQCTCVQLNVASFNVQANLTCSLVPLTAAKLVHFPRYQCALYLTIIPWAHVGYEVINNKRDE